MQKSFSKFFNEAISLKDAKKLKLSKKYSGAYYIEKLNEVFKSKDRIILDIKIGDSYVIKEHPLFIAIRSILAERGYELRGMESYIKGVAYKFGDHESKQPFKIGRLLQKFYSDLEEKNPELSKIYQKNLKSFMDDPVRATKKAGYKVVISRHPYDIAGMSTDRNWSSCMNLGIGGIQYKGQKTRGAYAGHVNHDIKKGTIVAYLVDNDDRHTNGKIAINKPISRILMKPFINDKNEYAYSIGKIYGGPVAEFKEFVKDWLVKNINKDTKGKYVMASGLYADEEQYPNFEGSTDSEIPHSAFLETLAEMNNPKLTEIELLDFNNNEYYGGRSATIQITFNISSNIPDFNYDHTDNLPSFVKDILDILPNKITTFLNNIYYTSGENEFGIIIRPFDSTYEPQEDEKGNQIPEDDDALDEYWFYFFRDWLQIHKWNYSKMKNNIERILEKTKPDEERQLEIDLLIQNFEKSKNDPRIQKLLQRVKSSYPFALKYRDYFLQKASGGLLEIWRLIDDQDFQHNTKLLNEFFINYGLLREFLMSLYKDHKGYVYISGYDEYKKLVFNFMNFEKFHEDFTKPMREITPFKIIYGNIEEFRKLRETRDFSAEKVDRVEDFIENIQPNPPVHRLRQQAVGFIM